jgi:cytochrome P450
MQLFGEEMRRNPFPVYAQFRESSPVARGPSDVSWMVFDYENVKRILDDPATYSSQATPAGASGKPLEWMIFSDPPRHTKLRALVSKAFTPRMIAEWEPRIAELSRKLLGPLKSRGEMDMAADYAIPLPTMVIADMLGIPADDWARFKRWSDGILLLSDTISGTAEDAARAGQAFFAVRAEMEEYLDNFLKHRAAQSNNLLSRLAAAEVDGQKLTPKEILGFFQLLLLAGNETTTNLINNAILCLTENPDQMAKLRERMELLPGAIEEVLRYRSPLQITFRAIRKDVEIHGQKIPSSSLVLVMLGSANRDPKQFREPEKFDITREPNPHLAFGHGFHFCLGAPLSRLEARIALTDLLTRTKKIGLALEGQWHPRRAFHVHGPVKLPIRFVV